MELIYWWMPLVWLLAVAAVVAVAVLATRAGRRRKANQEPLWVAHSGRLTALPGYRRALTRYRRLVVATIAAVAVLLLAGTALGSRVVSTTVFQPELRNRDIVLCL